MGVSMTRCKRQGKITGRGCEDYVRNDIVLRIRMNGLRVGRKLVCS